MSYLKGLALMFVGAVPIAAILTAVLGVGFPERPGIMDHTIAALVRQNLQVLYLWAWPVVGLLSILHTAAVHGLPSAWGLQRRGWRIALGVGAGALFGITIGVAADLSLAGLVRGILEYVILGGVYGLLSALLVSLPWGRRSAWLGVR